MAEAVTIWHRGQVHTVEVLPVGLRERKKLAVRAALIDAAFELFEANGVDGTSVEQIAERVDVSPRTFHRYFPSKDDVLFVDVSRRLTRLDEVLRSRPHDEPLLATLEAAAVALVELAPDAAEASRRLTIIEANDRLRARSLRSSEELADMVAAAAARRLGQRRTAALPQLLGSWTLATVRTTYRRWVTHPRLDPVAELRHAFAALADVAGATTAAAPGERT